MCSYRLLQITSPSRRNLINTSVNVLLVTVSATLFVRWCWVEATRPQEKLATEANAAESPRNVLALLALQFLQKESNLTQNETDENK